MRKEVIIKIPQDHLAKMRKEEIMILESRIAYCIDNEIVLYNEPLDFHYVLREVWATENFKTMGQNYRLVIDILEDIKEIGNTSLLEHQIRSLV